MSKKKKILLVCGCAVLLLVIILASISNSNRNAVPVQTAKAERVDLLTSIVTASGEIRAEKYVNLQSEVAGIITEIMVKEGDKVNSGDVLLQIDPIQREADKNIAVAGYEQAVADVRNRKIDLVNAELDLKRDEASFNQQRADLLQKENNFKREQNSFKRQQKLHEEGLISHDEYEIAQNSLRSTESILQIQRESIKQMEAQIELSKNRIEQMELSVKNSQAQEKSARSRLIQARDNAKKTTIISPQDGVIVKLAKEVGERAVPGNQNNPEATIMEIADLSIIQAELKVDETEIIGLALGDFAEVEIDALPDEIFEGEVTEIGNSPIAGTSQQEAKDFKVIVTLKAPSPKLRPGLSCTSDITTETRADVLAIPIQALTIREVEVDEDGEYQEPDLDNKNNESVVQADTELEEEAEEEELEGVFVIDEEIRARFRPIDTGITGESDIEVLENLKDGEEIVTGSFQTLRTIKDGEYVIIANKDKSESD